MNRLGRSELNYGEYRSVASTLGHIDAVTLDEVNAVARQALSSRFGGAVLGPFAPSVSAATASIDCGLSSRSRHPPVGFSRR